MFEAVSIFSVQLVNPRQRVHFTTLEIYNQPETK